MLQETFQLLTLKDLRVLECRFGDFLEYRKEKNCLDAFQLDDPKNKTLFDGCLYEDRCASGQRHRLQACPSQAIITKNGTLVAWYTRSTHLNKILVLHARSGLGSDGGLFRNLGFQRSHLVLSILGSFSTAGMLPKPEQLCLVLSFFSDEPGRVTRSTFAKMPS